MEKFLKVTVNGTAYDVKVEEVKESQADSNVPIVNIEPEVKAEVKADAKSELKLQEAPKSTEAGGVQVKAPMPGNIWKLKISVGTAVKKNDVLLILEAMKMENEIVAPADGTVANILIKEGDTVSPGQVMVELA